MLDTTAAVKNNSDGSKDCTLPHEGQPKPRTSYIIPWVMQASHSSLVLKATNPTRVRGQACNCFIIRSHDGVNGCYTSAFMDKATLIRELQNEIDRLTQARDLLSDGHRQFPHSGRARRGRRHMSADARARIAAAQKKRWAKVKDTQNSTGTASSAKTPSQGTTSGRRGPRRMSAEARARIAAAQRKRWAATRAVSVSRKKK